MILSNFTIKEFLGILIVFIYFVWLFVVIFNGLGSIKESMSKK